MPHKFLFNTVKKTYYFVHQIKVFTINILIIRKFEFNINTDISIFHKENCLQFKLRLFLKRGWEKSNLISFMAFN